jgi:hypothetical protein
MGSMNVWGILIMNFSIGKAVVQIEKIGLNVKIVRGVEIVREQKREIKYWIKM